MSTASSTSRRLFLVDGSGYLYRAFYGVHALTRSDGLPTNAVFGFVKMLRRVLERLAPDAQGTDYLAIAFDARGATFRHTLDAEYKATRKSMPDELRIQIPLIHRVLAAFGVHHLDCPGFEADDIIGTLARQGVEAGMDVVIVSGDKDLMQLVAPQVRLYEPAREQWIDAAEVADFWGVPPGQVVEVMGLAGDSSDNIPGIPGIGPKIAAVLIREFGSLDAVLAGADRVPQAKRRALLQQYGAQATRSRALATIRCDVPLAGLEESLNPLRYRAPDVAALRELYRELEFTSLLRELGPEAPKSPIMPGLGLDMDVDMAVGGESGLVAGGLEKRYHTLIHEADFQAFVRRLGEQEHFAMDTETTSTDPMRAELVGLSFSWCPGEAWYIPVGHCPEAVPDGQLSRSHVLDALRPVLESTAHAKTGQNLKYDRLVLANHGVMLAGIAHDVMLMSYLLHGTTRRHNLDAIAQHALGRETIRYEEVTRVGRGHVRFDAVPLDRAAPYACEDAEVTWHAAEVLWPQLAAMPDLKQLYEQVELPLLTVLSDMERVGTLLDRQQLQAMSADFMRRRAVLTEEIHHLAGERFNINSPQQLGTVLFEKMGIPGGKRTRTGYATDVSILTRLADLGHVLPERVLAYRTLTKLQSTYTDALEQLVHPETGRVHTRFNQAVTLTGRLSSSDPNLQNIPVRTEEGRAIRGAFVAPPGWVLLAADYNQIELRLLAHMGDIARLKEAFLSGVDVHTATAADLLGIDRQAVTPDQRRMAKMINFGLIYGMSPFGLAQRLSIDRYTAKDYMERYFIRYPGVREYMARLIQEARSQGYVTTLAGRRCPIADIGHANRALREMAERTAINAPLQGSAADVIKIAMVRLHRALREHGLRSRMVLQVHDELLLEVPLEELEAVQPVVRQAMEGVMALSVPLCVDIGHGANWSAAH